MSERIEPSLPNPEHFRETYLRLPPFTVAATGIPGPFKDVALLGLRHLTLYPLNQAGIKTIRELNEMPDSALRRLGGVGRARLTEIRERISDFSNELLSLQGQPAQSGVQEVIHIYAIDWLATHDLTWAGSSKTDLMTAVERHIGNLGIFLREKYVQEKKSVSEIARMIADASGGIIQISHEQITLMLPEFAIAHDPERIIEQRRKTGILSEGREREILLMLQNAPRGRVSNEQAAQERELLEKVERYGLVPGLPFTDRDWIIMRARIDGVSQLAIGEIFGISSARIAQLERRARRIIHARVGKIERGIQ